MHIMDIKLTNHDVILFVNMFGQGFRSWWRAVFCDQELRHFGFMFWQTFLTFVGICNVHFHTFFLLLLLFVCHPAYAQCVQGPCSSGLENILPRRMLCCQFLCQILLYQNKGLILKHFSIISFILKYNIISNLMIYHLVHRTKNPWFHSNKSCQTVFDEPCQSSLP